MIFTSLFLSIFMLFFIHLKAAFVIWNVITTKIHSLTFCDASKPNLQSVAHPQFAYT